MKIDKVLDWVNKQRKLIIDPTDEGWTEQEILEQGCLNEWEQAKLQLLSNLEDFINEENN